MDDKTQTDAANLAATGNTGNANPAGQQNDAPGLKNENPNTSGTQVPVAKTEPPKNEMPAGGSETGKVGEGTVLDEKTVHGEVRGTRPITQQDVSNSAQGLNTVEGRVAQIEKTERHIERMSDHNEEGHDKNMQRAAEEAERAHAATAKAPTSGKELNRNTPRVDKHGNKHWVD